MARNEFLDLKNGRVQIFRLIFQFLNKKKFFCADRPILGKFSIDFGNAQIFATPSTKTMINRERDWFRGWNFGKILTTYSSWYSVKMGLFYFLGALCENPIWNNPYAHYKKHFRSFMTGPIRTICYSMMESLKQSGMDSTRFSRLFHNILLRLEK